MHVFRLLDCFLAAHAQHTSVRVGQEYQFETFIRDSYTLLRSEPFPQFHIVVNTSSLYSLIRAKHKWTRKN